DARDEPGLPETPRELADIAFIAIHLQEAAIAFEHGRGAGKAVRRKIRGQEPAFGGAPEMQALDHGAGARARELDEPARQRSRDTERIGHAFRIEAEQTSASHRSAEWAGGARRMKAARLIAVLGGAADTDEHFGASDEGGEQRTASKPALLRQ